MKSKILNFLCIVAVMALYSCQDKDYDIAAPVLSPIDAENIIGSLEGDNYVWTFPTDAATQVNVTVYQGKALMSSEIVDGNSFTHSMIDTNIDYTYVFRRTDGTNQSEGVVKYYTRPGASKIDGLGMSQIEKENGYDAKITWNAPADAETVLLSATDGTMNINEELSAALTEYVIKDVTYGQEWTVTLTAKNERGSSLPVSSSLKIGKTAVCFLSVYPTPEELVANGDDDEASAWLWLKEEYPNATYIYFGDIASAKTLEPYRVAFWIRDLEGVTEEDVWNMPQVVKDATPAVAKWYADGGNLLLWSHAVPFIGDLGRLDKDLLKGNDHAFGFGNGGVNQDTWSMAVQLNPGGNFKKDASSHPIFKGLEVTETDRTKLIKFKGPGWTEDHNCIFFNIPSVLTGLGNQEEACYTASVNQYGIIPLGTWDSQIDWVSQLNVWEAQQGNTEFKGTVLCIGNGGCEFSMRYPDGSPDISAHPKNNSCQDNVLTLARNSIEYLKTR